MVNIFTLTSPVHDAQSIDRQTASFLASLESAGVYFNNVGEDYERYGEAELDILFVRTGGTEGTFLRLTDQYPSLTARPVLLLASGESNSLAASVEILSWLNAHGLTGEILHGDASHIAAVIQEKERISLARKQLNGQRAGVVGQPSDWLIASRADEVEVAKRLGVTLVNIDINELLEELSHPTGDISAPHPTGDVSATHPTLAPCSSKYFNGAMAIYHSLRTLIRRYNLNALTLRCFDLLGTVHNTGCLALALLNSEGVPAGCEGDVPALLTMLISQALTGQTGFMANPSRINPATGEVLFAHCTVPLNMLRNYVYDTHFESGIGVALHGEIPEGPATIFKVNGALRQWFAEDVTLESNSYEKHLCRTQVTLKTEKAAEEVS